MAEKKANRKNSAQKTVETPIHDDASRLCSLCFLLFPNIRAGKQIAE